MAHPIKPTLVENAPCQEIVISGDDLLKPGNGLDGIPVPISTPGWDNGPYTTLSQYITKDPDNGIQNMGNYRGQVKSPTRLGMNPSLELRPGIMVHWEKYRKRGEKMPAAVVLGCPPSVAFTSAQKCPESLDEFEVAGGLVGAPINVVRAKTVDLLVPAEAEIVIEGYISTKDLEPEAPFGESHGHVNLQEYNAYMEVTAITRKKKAILTSIISQVTPSESSLMKRVAMEPMFTAHLRDVLGCRSVIKVSMHEPLTNLRKFIIVTMKESAKEPEIWRALAAENTGEPIPISAAAALVAAAPKSRPPRPARANEARLNPRRSTAAAIASGATSSDFRSASPGVWGHSATGVSR
jgi:4-hydroxy-3-polyprenylbenzoate decarboxylase